MSQLALQPMPIFAHPFYPAGESEDSKAILKRWHEATVHHYDLPITRQSRTIGRQFSELAETWRSERGPTSSLTKLIMHPAYQQIIGLGPVAVPVILRELAQRPDHWFWALSAITGANPIRPEHRGNLRKMTQDWLCWGRETGHIL
jgi:hypothetical protein